MNTTQWITISESIDVLDGLQGSQERRYPPPPNWASNPRPTFLVRPQCDVPGNEHVDMTGHVRRNGPSWQYVIPGPPTPNGDRAQLTKSGFTSKRSAERAMHVAIVDTESATATRRDVGTLHVWMAHKWFPAHKLTIKRSTAMSYESIIRNHIASDSIGSMKLTSLQADDLDAFFTRLSTKPGRARGSTISRKTLKNIFRVLKTALDHAYNKGIITANPIEHVREPQPTKPVVDVWTIDEFNQFFEFVEVDNPRMSALYTFVALTGLRRGEAAGLEWRRVDFDAGTVRIEQTRLDVAGAQYIEKPKTPDSFRTIKLKLLSLEALRHLKTAQAADRDAFGSDWTDSGFVFTNEMGHPLRPAYFTERFRRDVNRSGVRHIKFHALRHTFITYALNAGENVKTVSGIAGHGDIQITLGMYSQHIPGQDDGTMETVEQTLFGNRKTDVS